MDIKQIIPQRLVVDVVFINNDLEKRTKELDELALKLPEGETYFRDLEKRTVKLEEVRDQLQDCINKLRNV